MGGGLDLLHVRLGKLQDGWLKLLLSGLVHTIGVYTRLVNLRSWDWQPFRKNIFSGRRCFVCLPFSFLGCCLLTCVLGHVDIN